MYKRRLGGACKICRRLLQEQVVKTYRSKPHALYSVYLLPPLNLGLEWKNFRNKTHLLEEYMMFFALLLLTCLRKSETEIRLVVSDSL